MLNCLSFTQKGVLFSERLFDCNLIVVNFAAIWKTQPSFEINQLPNPHNEHDFPLIYYNSGNII